MLNVYNTPREKELTHLLTELIKKDGYKIVRVRTHRYKTNKKCQIMISNSNNTVISIKDCEKVNKYVLEIVQNQNIGLQDYIIEVSSPGLDKPLTELNDFIEAIGKVIKIHTLFKVLDKKNFKGYLTSVSDNCISIKLITDTSDTVNINFDAIAEAYLQYEK